MREGWSECLVSFAFNDTIAILGLAQISCNLLVTLRSSKRGSSEKVPLFLKEEISISNVSTKPALTATVQPLFSRAFQAFSTISMTSSTLGL